MKTILSNNYADQTMILVLDDDSCTPVLKGEVHGTSRGEEVIVTGGRSPHKPSSTGKIWVKYKDGYTLEYYPSVIGARWVRLIT